MTTKTLRNRLTAVLCAAAAAVSALPFAAYAEESEPIAPAPVRVLGLGDDCLAEPAQGTSPVSHVASYFSGTAVNLAEIGKKTDELLTEVQSDAETQAEIQKADVILISIGVNDLIQTILYDNSDLLDMSQCSTLDDVANALPGSDELESLTAANQKVTSVLPSVTAAAADNIKAAVQAVKKQNASANIVVQTILNPLSVDNKKINTSQNRRSVFTMLHDYLNACLLGGTATNAAASLTIETGLNTVIQGLSGVSVSDFFDPIEGAAGEAAMGFDVTNIANLDMTCTDLGSVLVAASCLNADPMLACGNGSVLAAAYEATGRQADLQSGRQKLDEIITTAASVTAQSYALGDVNNSGKIDTMDAYNCLLETALRGAGSPGTLNPLQRRAADADNNNIVNTTDAYLWLLYAATMGANYDITLSDFLAENGRAA